MLRSLEGRPVSEPFRTSPSKPRRIRNGFSIHAYTGSNGGGKTMCAVYDSLPALAAGRPIVSTCRILDPTTGEPHPLWVPLDDFRVLLELSYCDVIMDEVTGVASSRASASMPHAVTNHLQQLRKGDTTVRWTTPNWKRADTAIREVTQGLTTCVGVVKSTQTVESEDGLTRRWQQRRGFVWRTYDAKNFDEWSANRERGTQRSTRLKPVARQFMWGPGLLAREMYDTYEHALTLGVVSDAGLCMDCGGARSARRCACAKSEDGPVSDPSVGMLRWREVDAARRRRVVVELPETDDTPGVAVELDADTA